MRRIIARLTPFVMAGIALVAFAFGLMLLAYLLIFGALVGLALFTIVWIRETFFPPKDLVKKEDKRGRTIDHP